MVHKFLRTDLGISVSHYLGCDQITSVFLTIQEEKTIFCLLDFFGEFFLFFILSKSNFPVWFFCIFLPCPPQAKKIRVLDRKMNIFEVFLPAAGEFFWRFFAFCQPKKHCQILKCEFAYHCILQMKGTLTGVPIVDALTIEKQWKILDLDQISTFCFSIAKKYIFSES